MSTSGRSDKTFAENRSLVSMMAQWIRRMIKIYSYQGKLYQEARERSGYNDPPFYRYTVLELGVPIVS